MIPRTQVIRMPQRMLPLTSLARRMAVTRIPISARRTVMPCEEKVPSATEDLKEKMLTSVESFPTTILAFWSPINAIKRPIPTDTACFRFIGMELKIASRTLVRESRIKMIPSANTAASACCQEYPIPRTTV